MRVLPLIFVNANVHRVNSSFHPVKASLNRRSAGKTARLHGEDRVNDSASHDRRLRYLILLIMCSTKRPTLTVWLYILGINQAVLGGEAAGLFVEGF